VPVQLLLFITEATCLQSYAIHQSVWKEHSANFAITEFYEVRRFLGALTCFVPQRTYTPLTQEYAAFVT
jgi:hypothetical protein